MLDTGEPKRLLRLEYVPLDSLKPDPRNARKHSKQQLETIAASIDAFGFNNPILFDADRLIVAGEGRWRAGKLRRLAEVPAICLGHLTEAQRRAYALADNRIALDATWDDAKLARELAALEAGMAKAAGFTDKEVEKLLAAAMAAASGEALPGGAIGLTDPDTIPDTMGRPVSQAGDIWLCGKHRVACGDCTSPELVAALLAGAKPHLMDTDPPYGVDYDPAWRATPEVEATRRAQSADSADRRFVAAGEVTNDGQVDWSPAWRLFPGDVAYVWCASLHSPEVALSLDAAGFERRAQIIWRKPQFAISRGHYHWQHEPCWYVVRKGATGHWAGDRRQTTVWDIASLVGFTSQTDGPNARTGHSTQKPVDCMRKPILNNSKPGELVYDPFLGSGTTLIAAEMTGRVCYGAEIAPAYADLAVRRWQDFTGHAARLEGDSRTFEATGVERGALLAI